ncbi:YusW family protein [Lederbergia sp. NSJ-179]|uniref:YusW family protein n=1 Tax=Lederbergia sp. NSJ-179 TaxID=2931402 RepID=UPI001FD5D69C|nr:YusW family protein [Lederbergia sp. NSJ-179]MCJ7839795.1 YusW family protein [Lederbergia sp. NSJ-179]
MKRIFLVFYSLVLIGFLGACQSGGGINGTNKAQDNTNEQGKDTNDHDSVNDSTTTDQTNDSDDQEQMKSQMDKLDFAEIEMEISYGKDQEYEAEIEQDKNRPIEAKVEDEINNEFLKGKEAFDSIYTKAEKLTLTKDSSDQETIDQVLNAFGLDKDYEKFEVEITFNDGSRLDVEDRKTP